jgi:hypothetical protein
MKRNEDLFLFELVPSGAAEKRLVFSSTAAQATGTLTGCACNAECWTVVCCSCDYFEACISRD